MFSPKPFHLLIGDQGILLDDGKDAWFAPSRDSTETRELAGILRAQPNRPLNIMVDTKGAILHQEILPAVGLPDRKKLCERRLHQVCSQALASRALPLGSTGKGYAYLFVALESSRLWTEWCQWIDTHNNSVGTVTILPAEAPSLMRRIPVTQPAAWQMTGFWTKTSGLRLMIYHQGQPVMTRVAALDACDHKTALQEIQTTISYLGRYGLHDVNELSVALVAPESWHDKLPQLNPEAARWDFLTPRKLALRTGIDPKQMTDRDGAEILFTRGLMGKPPIAALALPDLQNNSYRTSQGGWWRRAAIASFATTLGIAGLLTFMANRHMQTMQEGWKKINETQHQLASLPRDWVDPAVMEKMLQPSSAPWESITKTAKVIGKDYRLEEWTWNASGQEASMTIAARTAQTDLTLTDATRSLQNLGEKLRHEFPQAEVTATRLPLAVQPKENLRLNETSDSSIHDQTALFHIKEKLTP